MIWQYVWGIVGGIIVAVGGAGAIIVGISKWFGNVIAERISQKNKARYDKELEELKSHHQKEIEQYKSELSIVCEAVKKRNTESIYVTEKQFDREIALIQELTEKAFVVETRAKMLFPTFEYVPNNEQKRRELEEEKCDKLVVARFEFINILGKSRAFIDEQIYLKYFEMDSMIATQLHYFIQKTYNGMVLDDKFNADCYKRNSDIGNLNTEINQMIKSYLQKLKVINYKEANNGQAGNEE